MKIVFVSDAVYPYNKGGKEKRLYEISTRLGRLGHDVHIYTMHWWSTPETSRIEDGVTLHALSKHYDMYHGDRRSIKEGVLFALACLKLWSVSFDVIDVDHMPFFPVFTTWLICVLRGRKLRGTWHEALTLHDWTAYMGKAGYIAALIEWISIRLPYSITAASVRTQQQLATHHKRSKRVNLIPSGIDVASVRRIKPADAACDILYVGRLVKDKNVDKLVMAMATVRKAYPTVQCSIIGHGVEKENLKRLISSLHLENAITLLDPLPNAKNILAYMKRAKVFVLPSVREGFGIVALEALSLGTPVVTIDAPANAAKDLVRDDITGSVIPLKVPALAEAIETWLQRGKRSLGKVDYKNYDWNVLAARQEETYAL